MNGAGDGIRTRDINLGKVALYQLSYSRSANLGRPELELLQEADPAVGEPPDFGSVHLARGECEAHS